jgi:hypothetical protein
MIMASLRKGRHLAASSSVAASAPIRRRRPTVSLAQHVIMRTNRPV